MSRQGLLGGYGFGPLSTVMNPVIAPWPMFGPKMRPPPKWGVGRPRNLVIIDYAGQTPLVKHLKKY